MRNDERKKQILEILKKEENIRVSDLIEKVEGSAATVRRDLINLEQNGLITRRHGFVKNVKPDMGRQVEFSSEMIGIAKAAARMVEDGDTIMLDSGDCTLALAYQLTGVRNLTVITNSVAIAALYNSVETIQTYLTGGVLRVKENALVGTDTVETIRKMHADKLFLSTTGFRETMGLTCVSQFQEDVKRAFIQSADEVILLAVPQNFQRDAVRVFAGFDQLNCVITSGAVESGTLLESLKKNSVKIVTA